MKKKLSTKLFHFHLAYLNNHWFANWNCREIFTCTRTYFHTGSIYLNSIRIYARLTQVFSPVNSESIKQSPESSENNYCSNMSLTTFVSRRLKIKSKLIRILLAEFIGKVIFKVSSINFSFETFRRSSNGCLYCACLLFYFWTFFQTIFLSVELLSLRD